MTLPFCLSPQQAHRRGNSKLPPPWAIVAIAILGFNEIMALLRYLVVLCSVVLYTPNKLHDIAVLILCRNPIYLFLLFVGYLIFKALAMQLDVSREFQNGVV